MESSHPAGMHTLTLQLLMGGANLSLQVNITFHGT